MSANIHFNESTNEHSFFSVKEKAWHGLGQIIDRYPSSSEAIRFAGLDYEVVKTPIFTKAIDLRIHDQVSGNELAVPNYFATLRSDSNTPLGVVGKDYHIVQNKDAFTFFDSIVKGEGIFYETAGALGKGERIFITAKLPGYIKVGTDMIEKYLFLTNSHDGSASITAAFTPVRIVCQNTLNSALSNMSNVIRVRHTVNANKRLRQAYELMGMTNRFAAELEPVFNHWSKVRISDKDLKTLIQLAMAPNGQVLGDIRASKNENLSTQFTNMVESVYEYGLGSETQNMSTTAGTVFGAYNAVTGYFQNIKNYKEEDAKIKSLLLGGTAQLKSQKAFDLCEGFAAHGSASFNLN